VSSTLVLVQAAGVAVGSGVGVGAGSVGVGRGGDGVVLGREHAARSEDAAAMARSPGVVRRTTFYTGRAAIIGWTNLL
jgi:hypothetical protein